MPADADIFAAMLFMPLPPCLPPCCFDTLADAMLPRFDTRRRAIRHIHVIPNIRRHPCADKEERQRDIRRRYNRLMAMAAIRHADADY